MMDLQPTLDLTFGAQISTYVGGRADPNPKESYLLGRSGQKVKAITLIFI